MREVLLAERPLVVTVVVAFGLWVLLQMVQQALYVVMLVLLAGILAAAMMPIVGLIRRVRLPLVRRPLAPGLAVLLIYLAVVLLLSLVSYLVGAVLVQEVGRFVELAPAVLAQTLEGIRQLAQALGLGDLLPSPEQLAAQAEAAAGALAGQTAEVVGGVIGFLFGLFILLALALFFVAEADRICDSWLSFFPPQRRERVGRLTTAVSQKMGRWVLGQVAIAFVVAVLAGIGAAVLALQYPLVVAVFTGILVLVPVVGPFLMVVPAALLGLAVSPLVAIAAAVYFLVLSEVANHVLTPIIMGRAIDLSPTLVLIAVPLGIALYGAIGALVAVPVAVAIQLITREVVLPAIHDSAAPPEARPEQPVEPEPAEAEAEQRRKAA